MTKELGVLGVDRIKWPMGIGIKLYINIFLVLGLLSERGWLASVACPLSDGLFKTNTSSGRNTAFISLSLAH